VNELDPDLPLVESLALRPFLDFCIDSAHTPVPKWTFTRPITRPRIVIATLASTALTPIMDSTGRLIARNSGVYIPPKVILSWPKANHIDPGESGWAAPVILWVSMGITFLVYIARMWARLVLLKSCGLGDILISFAMLPLFGLTISTVLGIRVYGFQWHQCDQTAATLSTTREVGLPRQASLHVLTRPDIQVYRIELPGVNDSDQSVYSLLLPSNRRLSHKPVHLLGVEDHGVLHRLRHSLQLSYHLHLYPDHGILPYRRHKMARLQNELTCRNEGAIIVACAAISSV
jgi:hypothetical protein